jgi:hypothetical protein
LIAPWWKRYPGRLEWEERELRDAGIPFEHVENMRAAHQVVQLRLSVPLSGSQRALLATFPDLYPWFRFEVATVDGPWLGRHHHPFGGNLCLLGRATGNWHFNDSLASFLTTRLPQVEAAAANPESDEAADTEEQAGEPFSDYYTYGRPPDAMLPGSWFGVSGAWKLPTGPGSFDAAVQGPSSNIQGVLLSVRDGDRNECAVGDVRQTPPHAEQVTGRWLRVSEPVIANDAAEAIRVLETYDETLATPQWQKRGGQRAVDVVAAVFPEEVRWREVQDSWLFVVRVRGS